MLEDTITLGNLGERMNTLIKVEGLTEEDKRTISNLSLRAGNLSPTQKIAINKLLISAEHGTATAEQVKDVLLLFPN